MIWKSRDITSALGVLLPRLDSGGQRLRVWSGKGKVSREGRLHGGVPEAKYKHWHLIGTHTETDIEFRRALKDGSVQWLGKVIESEFLF